MPDALSVRECMHRSEGQFEGSLHGAVPGSGDGCFHAASSAIACRDRRRQGDPRSIIVTALSSSPSSLSPSIRPYPPNWSPLICDNLATQRPQPSTNGSLNTAAFTCPSPGPAPPGSIRWNTGSGFSLTNCCPRALTRALPHRRTTSATGSTQGMTTRDRFAEQRPSKRSSTPSPNISRGFQAEDTGGGH